MIPFFPSLAPPQVSVPRRNLGTLEVWQGSPILSMHRLRLVPLGTYRNWVWYKEPSPYDHFRQNSYGGKIRIIYVKKDVNLIKERPITIVISSRRNRVCLCIIRV